MTRVVTVANTKGGSAKTTTVAYLAHALTDTGHRVCGIDADPAGSLLRWREHAGWAVPVVGMPSKRLHLDLVNIMDGTYGWLIVDTPPVEDQLGIVHSAIRAATDVVIPIGASTMELDRLSPILQAVDDAAAMKHEPPQVRVLLTRVHPQATSTTVAREVITDLGQHVLTAAVPTLERYKNAFGDTPHLPPGDPYARAAAELNGRTR